MSFLLFFGVDFNIFFYFFKDKGLMFFLLKSWLKGIVFLLKRWKICL